MYSHSLEERRRIEPGNTPIKKRTSSQSQVQHFKEYQVNEQINDGEKKGEREEGRKEERANE